MRLRHFWNRWRKECLTNLHEFHKCRSGKKEKLVEVGDVVVVYEEKRKRGVWKMGVVGTLVTGRDGIVRGVTGRVIMKGKLVCLSRPVQKLYLLEFRSEGEGTQTHKDIGNSKIPTIRVPPRNATLDS